VNSPQRQRLDLREQGRRRVSVATRASMLAGTALAAVFGLALAQHAHATANPHAATDIPVTPHTATSNPAPAGTAPSSSAPSSAAPSPPPSTAPSTTLAPPAPAPTRLQPPAQAPVPTRGGGSTGSSGGS
jgi:hypothetical protein